MSKERGVGLGTEELAKAGLKFELDSISEGAVATVTLNRPERRNAMTGSTWRGLARIGQSLPESVRVVIVRGEGPSFSAGIDLRTFTPEGVPGEPPIMRTDGTDAELDAGIKALQAGYLWLRRPGIVSVAAVQGHAVGAGFQLALACDIRILADDAQLCMKEPALGLVPDLTGSKPLVDIVGVNRALELCLTARSIGAEEAYRLLLAELVVPAASLDGTVADLVAALLAVDRGAATATKALLQQARENTLEQQAAAERAAQIGRLRALAAAARATAAG
ncbi:MAG: enoyl-CoA hydratase/isomerase family protein [Streptosporangiales bacterium]|nr:enoyl-CoA hydratase/isomerase family protein [Streptosporangiales bacterium]